MPMGGICRLVRNCSCAGGFAVGGGVGCLGFGLGGVHCGAAVANTGGRGAGGAGAGGGVIGGADARREREAAGRGIDDAVLLAGGITGCRRGLEAQRGINS